MFQQISDFLTNGVAVVIYWFTVIIDKTGMAGLLIAAFVVFQSCRLLLFPLLGQASSDTVGAWYSGTRLGRSNADKYKANRRTPQPPPQRYWHGDNW